MFKASPIFTLYFSLILFIFFIFLVILSGSGLAAIPTPVFQIFALVFGFIFFWWPVDLIINWDKQTEVSKQKDRILACLALGTILFIIPYYFWATPFYPTLIFAVVIGLILPGFIGFIRTLPFRQVVISPGLVQHKAMETAKAKAFVQRFPDARHYVIGYEGGGNKNARYVLHHRQSYPRFEDAFIDYVLSIPVQKKKAVCIEGMEKLEAYLFINDGSKAGVAFLPTSNFGRVLDIGFTDDEIDGAVEEAKQFNQEWRPVDFEPIVVQHFRGKTVRMK